jgi:hypothetical protein
MNRNRKPPGPKLVQILTSVKTALVLLGCLIVYAVLSTLFPGVGPASIWYHSPVFFLLIGLFTLNLASCTVYRILRRLRTKAPPRFGPDIIHISLILFVVGGLLSVANRQEAFSYVRAGDIIELPGGERVLVTELEAAEYSDGRPKYWHTIVRYGTITDDTTEHTIEVNHPLKISGYTFYQETFGKRPVVRIGITGQEDVHLREGEAIGILRFDGITAKSENEAVFTLQYADGEQQIAAAPGNVIAEMALDEIRLMDIRMENISGLKIVRDPSFTPIVIAFVLLSTGLVLTFFQKIRDQKKGDEKT